MCGVFFSSSAFEVKTKLSLFKSSKVQEFKMKKNDVFFFVISSLILKIFKLKENK